MIQSFIGAVIGAALGWAAGAGLANIYTRADFGVCVMLGLGCGSIVGSIIGATGEIVHAIRNDATAG